MTRSHEIAAAALLAVLVLAFAGLAVDYFWLEVSWWPLVGGQWRAARRQDLPGPVAPCAGETPGQYQQGDNLAVGRAGESFTDDEWEQLDPDTQAETLIAEWHAPESEAMTSTDTLRLLDDAELLLWDCRRQVQRIKDIRHDYRLEMARLMAERAREIDARAA